MFEEEASLRNNVNGCQVHISYLLRGAGLRWPLPLEGGGLVRPATAKEMGPV